MTNPLNLDALYGESEPIEVTWRGVTYAMRPLAALSPREIARLSRYQMVGAQLDEENADELEGLVNEMLGIICPDLPLDELPFMVRVAALQYYQEQTAPIEAQPEKKAHPGP